jgi:hypothetical protein
MPDLVCAHSMLEKQAGQYGRIVCMNRKRGIRLAEIEEDFR